MTWRPGAAVVPQRIDGYAPIEQCAAIGDGRTVALVAAGGATHWWCRPDINVDASVLLAVLFGYDPPTNADERRRTPAVDRRSRIRCLPGQPPPGSHHLALVSAATTLASEGAQS